MTQPGATRPQDKTVRNRSRVERDQSKGILSSPSPDVGGDVRDAFAQLEKKAKAHDSPSPRVPRLEVGRSSFP